MTDNTVHLKKEPKWYNRKRPKLQIDILLLLTVKGKLSKGQAETILKKRHEDIIDSFDILEEKGLIKRIKTLYLEEEDVSIPMKLQIMAYKF